MRRRPCTSGTTASKLLRIQTEADDAGWQHVQDDIFGEEFLLQRPLMTAIASEDPVVLLIDEIDLADPSSRGCCSNCSPTFRSLPELARIDAKTHPVVLLTSNNTRELPRRSSAVACICGLITRSSSMSSRSSACTLRSSTRRSRASSSNHRAGAGADLKKPPASPSRSIGRGRSCCSGPRRSTRRRSRTR